MKPSSFSCPLSAKSTASQRKVMRVPPSCAMSSRVSTLLASRTPNPAKATAVRSSPNGFAMIQPATISANAIATIHSSRDIGPMSRRAARAAAGASGVALTTGGIQRYSIRGRSRIAASAGTDAATSHEPKPILRPACSASCTPMGLTEVAVSQSAEETARLAIPQNMR